MSSCANLSDAVGLSRRDHYFTHDFTPRNYTAWGHTDCQRDHHGFGFGSLFARLLLHTLPLYYSENSVYTYFAFMTPETLLLSFGQQE